MPLRSLLLVLCASLLIGPQALADQSPQRLVSAGGALSEWIVALGAESRLVAVDTTSQHPESLKALPHIGYQRQLSAEGILSLRPEVLVGTEEMGPPTVLEQLRAAGVKVEVLSAGAELATVQDNLKRLGVLLGASAQAGQLADAFVRQVDAQQQWVAQARTRQAIPNVLLLVGQGGGKPMVAGKGTAGDWVITRAGGRNLATHEGYKVLSAEALTGLDPQVLIVADRNLRGAAAREALLKENPLLAATAAGRDQRLEDLDPTLLVGGLSPRLPGELQRLAHALYPGANLVP